MRSQARNTSTLENLFQWLCLLQPHSRLHPCCVPFNFFFLHKHVVRRWTDGRTDGRMDGRLVGGRVHGWMHGWMHGWLVGWLDGWMDGWVDGMHARKDIGRDEYNYYYGSSKRANSGQSSNSNLWQYKESGNENNSISSALTPQLGQYCMRGSGAAAPTTSSWLRLYNSARRPADQLKPP